MYIYYVYNFSISVGALLAQPKKYYFKNRINFDVFIALSGSHVLHMPREATNPTTSSRADSYFPATPPIDHNRVQYFSLMVLGYFTIYPNQRYYHNYIIHVGRVCVCLFLRIFTFAANSVGYPTSFSFQGSRPGREHHNVLHVTPRQGRIRFECQRTKSCRQWS